MDTGRGASDSAQDAAREARQHPAVRWLARVGFLAYGLVHLVLAWLTAQLALGDRAGQVSKDGALQQLAGQPLGQAMLWVAAVGLAALVVWSLADAVVGHRGEDGAERWRHAAGSLFKTVVYAVLAWSAVRVATGDSGGSGSSTRGWTARLMEMPLGPLLVGIVGAVVIGYGCYGVYRGLSDKWRDQLDAAGSTGRTGKALTWLAYVGYCGRAVAFWAVGGFFVWAALTHDPARSAGLDQALGRLKEAPLGPVLLLVVALGLACYGVFNIAKARHLRPA